MTLTNEQLSFIKVHTNSIAHDATAVIWGSPSREYLISSIIEDLQKAVEAAGYTMQIAMPKEASNG